MIKKALIGTAVALGLGSMAVGTSALSYLQTGYHEATQAVRAEVPLEFEISRARNEIEKIVPEIDRCIHVIAEQQYDIEQRDARISERKLALEEQKDAILALRQDLETGKDSYVYASRTFSADEVRQDLSQRFERFKTSEETLNRDQQVVDARREALSANEKKLDGMISVKNELAVQIENLEARLGAVQASETMSDLQIDDSQLARAKTLINDLDRRIGTREKLLSNEGRFTGSIPVEVDRESKERLEKVESQVDAYFDAPAQSAEEAAEAPAA